MKGCTSAFVPVLTICIVLFESIDAVCERPLSLLAAEDICWTKKVKITDRIQYASKSVFNLAKEKLGLSKEESANPAQCDYYECTFDELKMMDDGYPNANKIKLWINNNIIYNQAIALHDRLSSCQIALARSVDASDSQGSCDIFQEFMKCLSIEVNDCIIFKYP